MVEGDRGESLCRVDLSVNNQNKRGQTGIHSPKKMSTRYFDAAPREHNHGFFTASVVSNNQPVQPLLA